MAYLNWGILGKSDRGTIYKDVIKVKETIRLVILGLLPHLGFNIQGGGRGYLQPERCAEKDTAHPAGAVTKAPLQKRGQKMIPQIASLPPALYSLTGATHWPNPTRTRM